MDNQAFYEANDNRASTPALLRQWAQDLTKLAALEEARVVHRAGYDCSQALSLGAPGLKALIKSHTPNGAAEFGKLDHRPHIGRALDFVIEITRERIANWARVMVQYEQADEA